LNVELIPLLYVLIVFLLTNEIDDKFDLFVSVNLG